MKCFACQQKVANKRMLAAHLRASQDCRELLEMQALDVREREMGGAIGLLDDAAPLTPLARVIHERHREETR